MIFEVRTKWIAYNEAKECLCLFSAIWKWMFLIDKSNLVSMKNTMYVFRNISNFIDKMIWFQIYGNIIVIKKPFFHLIQNILTSKKIKRKYCHSMSIPSHFLEDIIFHHNRQLVYQSPRVYIRRRDETLTT